MAELPKDEQDFDVLGFFIWQQAKMAIEGEVNMATARDIGVVNYCDRVYSELSGMKTRLLDFVKEIEGMTGPEKEMLQPHVPHFQDIVNTIDWKLEIISRVCPFEWTGAKITESRASVPIMEDVPEKEQVSGGYIGG